jgi:hypothetical protein
MTHQEILEKAIQKAIDGGWDAYGWERFQPIQMYGVFAGFVNPDDNTAGSLRTNDIIFNHDFAKALWGEDYSGFSGHTKPGEKIEDLETWQYHLQQMVVADDPIAYLGEHL